MIESDNKCPGIVNFSGLIGGYRGQLPTLSCTQKNSRYTGIILKVIYMEELRGGTNEIN